MFSTRVWPAGYSGERRALFDDAERLRPFVSWRGAMLPSRLR
jgi:hypothetical protein